MKKKPSAKSSASAEKPSSKQASAKKPTATKTGAKKGTAKKAAATKAAPKNAATTKAAPKNAAPTTKAAATKAAPKDAAATKAGTKPAARKNAAATAKAGAAKAGAAKAGAAKAGAAKAPMAARRADFGAPIDGFFAKQSPALRPVVDSLRKLVERAAPNATASLKWGMPFYEVDGEMLCAIGGHKSHVNLILPGAPGTFADPSALLQGEGKTGQHLKLRSMADLPEKTVSGWLAAAVKNARAKAKG